MAAAGLDVLVVAEIDQGIEVINALKNYVAAAAAVATVGDTKFNVLLTPKGNAAGAAVATLYVNLSFIEKLHGQYQKRCAHQIREWLTIGLSLCLSRPLAIWCRKFSSNAPEYL